MKELSNKILTSRGYLLGVLHDADHCKLSGASQGQAGNYYLIRSGVLLTANVFGKEEILISSDPDALWLPDKTTMQPVPVGCETVKVWQRGKWIMRGPWVDKIKGILSDINAEILEFSSNEERKKAEAIAAHEAEKKARHDALVQAWS